MNTSMLQRAKEADCFNIGVRIGGRVTPDEVIDEIREFCASPLVNVCYLLPPKGYTFDNLLAWVAELRRLETGFFLHMRSKELTREESERIKSAGGEFFRGVFVPNLNEYGTKSATSTYFVYDGRWPERESVNDLKTAFSDYIAEAKELTEKAKRTNGKTTAVFEATALAKYLYPAGVDLVLTETPNAGLEFQMAYSRGAARGYKKECWGTLLAHEWYGGLKNDDPLKFKRLKLSYDYMYMSGSNYVFIESGEYNIKSYGYYYDINHEFCKTYRRMREEFTKSILNDVRPSGKPMCKVGILHGNLDPYAGFATSTLMYHRNNEEWTIGTAERSWKLLDGMKKAQEWCDFTEFGPVSLSNAPGYGDYEIVPLESGLDVLCGYEYLIFLGWNSMTEEYYEKLKEYVQLGGKLLISAAHLNTNTKRDGAYLPVCGGKLSELLGCDIVGRVRADSAVQFIADSSVCGVVYPTAKVENITSPQVDPLFANGYADLATVELCGGKVVAVSNNTYKILPDDPPLLIENKSGKGTVFFVPSLDYPAAEGIREFYSYIMRVLFTASHRTCDVKVTANDKVKFTVYEAGNGNRKVYLLNTDFELRNHVVIRTDVEEIEISLDPLERKETVIRAGRHNF